MILIMSIRIIMHWLNNKRYNYVAMQHSNYLISTCDLSTSDVRHV